MKIAFDIQPLISKLKSGVAYHEEELIKNLITQYPENQYYFELFDGKNRIKGLKNKKYKNIKIRKCKWFSGRLYRFLSSFIPIPYSCFFPEEREITHFFNYYIPPFVKGKKVVTIHDMAFRVCPETVRKKTRLFLRLCIKKSIKRADKIITVSEFSKQEILHFYQIAEEKIIVIPNGVDFTRFHSNFKKDTIEKVKQNYKIAGKEYFLFLGNLEPRKNLVRLIQAYKIFLQQYCGNQNNIPLLVIAGGKGWMYQEIFNEVKRSNLEERVIFIGYVSDREIAALMAGAQIFCFPSLYEGFGMPVLEAMACGTPVLVSDIPALKEIVGDAGKRVNALSVIEIAKGMRELYFSKELQSIFYERGKERVSYFSWETASKKLYQVYQELKESR